MNDDEENELFDSYSDDFKEKLNSLNEQLDDVDVEKDKIEFFKKIRLSIRSLHQLVRRILAKYNSMIKWNFKFTRENLKKIV